MRVLVVADDILARGGLAALLAGQPGITVEQTAVDPDLNTVAERHEADVIVWDLGGDAGRAVGPLPAILDLHTPVIVLGDEEARLAEAVASGARGALPRDTAGVTLLAALEAVVQGLVVIAPAVAAAVAPGRSDTAEILAEELTARELEVLQLLAEGLPNKQIAQRLGISEHTVKFHLTTIFSKLGAHSRTEAVTRAARLGLILL